MNQLLNYILPNKCLSCSTPVDSRSDFCSNYCNQFSFIKEPYCSICSYQFEIYYILGNQICLSCMKSPPKFDFARCLLKYNESNKKLIHNFKYYDKTLLAKPISKILASRYFEEIKDVDIIIPAPMHKMKRIIRLYNHAQILAEEVGSFLGKEVRSDILLKVKQTKPQSSLNKASRLRNLAGSIKV